MNRRRFLKKTGTGLFLAAAGCAAPQQNPPARKPNIILCMADDQGWGDMAYNGHPLLETPHFDAMAAECVRFDRFYAAAPVCSPTRGSVLTGRHPNRFGCFKWGHTLRPQEITIAEALKTAGYVTGHFGKWHLGSVRTGSPVNPGMSGFDEWLSAPNFFDNDPILSREGSAVAKEGESSAVTVDAALEFIGRRAEGPEPFLAVVWFGSPHSPHKAIDEDRAPYADHPEKMQNFLGEITGMDRAFGRLRKGLRTLGIADNTILWYCSDNGGLPKLGATGGRGAKGMVYEGGLRVPALIEWPGHFAAPRAISTTCTTSDIYPTLLEIAGVRMAAQPRLDGISLVPAFDGRMDQRPEPIGFWDYPAKGIGTPSHKWMTELLEAQEAGHELDDPDRLRLDDSDRLRLDAGKIAGDFPDDNFHGHAAWLDWPWKLHRIEKKDEAPRIELYHLARDPEESKDLAENETGRAHAMRTQLEEWLASVVASLNGADYQDKE